MIILTIRTDRPEAEVGLFENERQVNYLKWTAHKELSVTLNSKIDVMLNKSSKSLDDIGGIIVFKGPGSFTGLRIGLSVANALSYSLNIPIVSSTTEQWITNGFKKLQNDENEKIALPEYGSDAFVSTPRK